MFSSLIVKVRLLGLFTALLVSVMVYLSLEYAINYAKSREITNAILLYKRLKTDQDPRKLKVYLVTHHFKSLEEKSVADLLKDAEDVIETPIYREVFQSGDIRLYYKKGYYYYAIKLDAKWHYFQNLQEADNWIFYIAIAMILLIIFLGAIHLYIIKALAPLKTLHQKIHRYANPEGSPPPRFGKYKDEVSEVSEAFDKAIVRIQSFQKGRTLFWRNVMHEMKTPLTQGLLIINRLRDSQSEKEKLMQVFRHMEKQLDGLKELEYIKTDLHHLTRIPLNVIDCIDDAKDHLLLDEEHIAYHPIDRSYMLDPTHFTTALKNLLSNAIKYASDHQACVCHKNDHLYIINQGNPLGRPFTYFLDAFKRGDVPQSGMGLGLYITHEILQKHEIAMRYRYLHGSHMVILDLSLNRVG